MPRSPLERFPAGPDPVVPVYVRTAALLGPGGVERLSRLKVAVVGLGGVGSWAAEFLARSGVGELHLFDPDRVDESNANRQLQAFPDTVGRFKAEVLAERLDRLHGSQDIHAHVCFVDAPALERFSGGFDMLVEAIDHVTAKCGILDWATKNRVPVVSSLGAASRMDPTLVRTADLADVIRCPLGSDIRKILRRKYGFPRTGLMGIDCVYSLEKPWDSAMDGVENGTIAPVTAVFGAAAASRVLQRFAVPIQEK